MSITLEASAAATSDRAVAFACDWRFLPYALFAAEQIARLHPARACCWAA